MKSLRKQRAGYLVGAVAILLGAAAFASGLLNRLDDLGLDLHFRYFSTIPEDPRLVLIDINDHAIRAVGDWPWPRRRYAQLVRTLDELGAAAIGLDLVLAEPQKPAREGLSKHYDVDPELLALGDPLTDPIIYDDELLRDAMNDAGNVYLAMLFRLSPPHLDPSAVCSTALKLLSSETPLARSAFLRRMRAAFPGFGMLIAEDDLYHQSRLAALLMQDFGVDAAVLADRLGYRGKPGRRTVEQHLPAAKRYVARRKAMAFLTERPEATFREFFESVLPEGDFQALSPDREDLIQAYRSRHALLALEEGSPPVPATLAGHIPHGFDLTLPVEKFARAARGIGFVSFEREKAGAVVRAIPLLAEIEGQLVSQLGFLMAMDVLGFDRAEVAHEDGKLLVGEGEHRRRCPLTADGLTLLNWHVPDEARRWETSFHHIPVARVLEIALNDEAVEENKRRLGLAMAELVKLRHEETPAEYKEYVRLVNQRLALDDDIAESPAARAELDARIRRMEEDALLWLRRVHGLWQGIVPANAQEAETRRRIERLHTWFEEGRLESRISKINQELMERSARLREQLEPQIEEKICLVGYTASGLADLVSSPVFESMPGVMAHANVINTLLQNQPVRRAPKWQNLFTAAVAGAAVTLVSCMVGPGWSAGFLASVVALLLAGGAFTFWTTDLHIASGPAAAQVCVVWACVTAYRQFTEQRARRQFQRALTQYTSPAVAAHIADEAQMADLAPRMAEVSCFFCDLYGFTRLSERLGPERTRLVLNPYLRTMSQVLVDHQAIVNKFMGDGIFAFFNAPIWPCESHSDAACDSALAAVEALQRLRAEPLPEAGDVSLAIRIGISTGNVFVGDYGSDTKLDYTCIGDPVNLASRLEEANKTLGTVILVDDHCRRRASDRFIFRPLGRIELPGRAEPATTYELVGYKDQVSSSLCEYLESFERAVLDYQAGDWARCLEGLEKCGNDRPEDLALHRYREAARRYSQTPPPPDWNRALPQSM